MRNLKIIGLCAFMFVGSLHVIAQKQEIPNDLVISLTRFPCALGWCPYYSLEITADRVVKFTPLAQYNYTYIGKGEMPKFPLQGRITADQVRVLIKEFEKIKFNSLRKQYGSLAKSKEGPSCPNYWTDSPSAEIVLKGNGRQKTVWHYLGCEGAKILDDLEALENKIDEVVNSKQWISQFGWDSANVVDLKIQKNPAPPATQKKPQ